MNLLNRSIYSHTKKQKIYKKSIALLIKRFIFAPSFEENDDLVAQLVEHLPFKERVLGSSPSQVTRKVKQELNFSYFYTNLKCARGGIGRRASLRG